MFGWDMTLEQFKKAVKAKLTEAGLPQEQHPHHEAFVTLRSYGYTVDRAVKYFAPQLEGYKQSAK